MILHFALYLCFFSICFNSGACIKNSESVVENTIPSLNNGKKLKYTEPLNTIRSVHTATLLMDGKVLIVGGMNNSENPLNSAEIYDPQTNKFTTVANMQNPRVGHTATLLKDGKVLIVGGYTDRRPTATCELYDPQINTFKTVGNMKIARGGHTSTLLQDGKVLIVGSENGEKVSEIYDPETRKFTESGSMHVSRLAHTATLLKNGEVLLSGGSFDHNLTKTAELFNPKTGNFSLTGEMSIVRHKHSAVLLGNGNVLIVGGSDSRDWDGLYSSVEVYQTSNGKFKNLNGMNVKRFKIASALGVLNNGLILISGGNETLEIFDPKTELFKLLEEKTDSPRFYTTATVLKNDDVLIIDGYDRSIKANGKAYIFRQNK